MNIDPKCRFQKSNYIDFLLFACHVMFFYILFNDKQSFKPKYSWQLPLLLSKGNLYFFLATTYLGFFLNRDNPNAGHTHNATNPFLYDTQSLGHVCIFLYSKLLRYLFTSMIGFPLWKTICKNSTTPFSYFSLTRGEFIQLWVHNYIGYRLHHH